MKYRLEVDRAYNVRPKKGERRERGTGRLVKATIWFGADLRDCMAQASANAAAIPDDGYSEIIAVRGYDNAAYLVYLLKAVPNFTSPKLI